MKSLALVVAFTFALGLGGEVYAKSSGGGGRPHYGGGKHTTPHGGHYQGGQGSSHKGGSYRNPRSGDQYGTHR